MFVILCYLYNIASAAWLHVYYKPIHFSLKPVAPK